MRNWTMWQDHVTEYEDRYRETQNDDGSVTHTPVPGSVIQQGTPQNAANFNKMEDGIINATEMAALAMTAIIHARQTEEDLAGEVINVDLTNTQDYPFNNSVKTVPLTTKKKSYKLYGFLRNYIKKWIYGRDRSYRKIVKWFQSCIYRKCEKCKFKNLCERWFLLDEKRRNKTTGKRDLEVVWRTRKRNARAKRSSGSDRSENKRSNEPGKEKNVCLLR